MSLSETNTLVDVLPLVMKHSDIFTNNISSLGEALPTVCSLLCTCTRMAQVVKQSCIG